MKDDRRTGPQQPRRTAKGDTSALSKGSMERNRGPADAARPPAPARVEMPVARSPGAQPGVKRISSMPNAGKRRPGGPTRGA